MKKYLVSYASDGTTADTVIYEAEDYDQLLPLILIDFFNYETGLEDDTGTDILESALALKEFAESQNFYEVCNHRGVYIGEVIELEQALHYIVRASNFN